MEGQRERTSSRRRQRRKAKNPRNKVVVEPVLIVARRPDSPLLKNGFHTAVASAHPKQSGIGRGTSVSVANGLSGADGVMANGAMANHRPLANGVALNGHAGLNGHSTSNGSGAMNGHLEAGAASGSVAAGHTANGALADEDWTQGEPLAAAPSDSPRGDGVRRRAVRIVKVTDAAVGPGNREQQLLDRLVRSEGRGAISRAANDLWENKFVPPKRQEVQIQLLEHENEHRARDAVFAMAELLQREAPIKRPVLDQRLRRLEQSAEDPITRDAAGALRRSMRVHHGA